MYNIQRDSTVKITNNFDQGRAEDFFGGETEGGAAQHATSAPRAGVA